MKHSEQEVVKNCRSLRYPCKRMQSCLHCGQHDCKFSCPVRLISADVDLDLLTPFLSPAQKLHAWYVAAEYNAEQLFSHLTSQRFSLSESCSLFRNTVLAASRLCFFLTVWLSPIWSIWLTWISGPLITPRVPSVKPSTLSCFTHICPLGLWHLMKGHACPASSMKST